MTSDQIVEPWHKTTIRTVLLIEDNPGDARLLLEMFDGGASKAKINVVKTMFDAERHLAGQIPDIILLDLGLPDAQGLTAVRRVRVAAPFAPLLVLTGLDDESMAAHALQEGAVDYLIKGELESRGLSRSLRYAIERRAIEDSLLAEKSKANVARTQAEDANRAKSRFLAGMSHELRTPLNGILGYAQLLRMDVGLNDQQLERINAMLSAGNHLLQMINGVLDLSEIEAGQIILQEDELDPRELASTCLSFVHPTAKAKNITLELVLAPEVPSRLQADATRLRQVLLNLLGNAVKFTSEGSVKLCIGIGANPKHLRFEVVDTGPGISPERRDKLFQEFKRLGGPGNDTIEGAGLGLAIAARLVALMGGELRHSDNPAGGSMFWLEMEVKSSAAPVAAATPHLEPRGSNPVPRGTPKLRILIVDDIAMNRDIAGSFLRAAGHAVVEAGGGVEAVEAVVAEDFDVVLMDVRMPGIDGLEATRRIRALDGPRSHVPIVALTAQVFFEQVGECREAGMDGHVGKPFTPESLLAAVLLAVQSRPAQPPCNNTVSEAPRVDTGGVEADNRLRIQTDMTAAVISPEPDPDLPTFDHGTFQRAAAFLPAEAVAAYLREIGERGEALLQRLDSDDVFAIAEQTGLAVAAHTLAGSGGMFGFKQLTAVALRFEHGIQTGANDLPLLAQHLRIALNAVLQKVAILNVAA